jgi:hypothetical protein
MANRPPRSQMTVADGVLLSMASNPMFRKQFPFLNSLHQQGRRPQRSCGSCGRKKTEADLYSRAKEALAHLPPAKQQQLKALLNTEKIRVRWIDANGNTQERNF